MIRKFTSRWWPQFILPGSMLLVSACAPAPDDATQASDVTIHVVDNTVLEKDSEALFTVSLSNSSIDPVSVDYATANDTASAGDDYQALSGSLTFAAGETSKQIAVVIIDDTDGEGSERFSLTLSNPVNANLAVSSVYARIVDDDLLDTVSTFNPHWGAIGVFADAETCSACHRASQVGETPAVMRYPDEQGEDVSPAEQWQHSVMAHAFDDPYFQAKVQDEVSLFPELAGFIEDKCLACHAGMGHTHAHQSDTGLSQENCPLDDGCYRYDQAEVDMHGREGVSCTLCHQIKEEGLGDTASFSGGYNIAKSGDIDAKTIYGPVQNPQGQAMQNQSGFEPLFGMHMTDSVHCATCHTLYTPTLDANTHEATGAKFLEQGVYLEWQNSVFFTGNVKEKQCQDCHMPDPEPNGYTTRIAVTPAGNVNTNWPERSPFATHSMVGANTHILDILKNYRSILGIDNSTTESGFEEKIVQTRAFLQQAASVEIASIARDGDQLNIDVKITNKTGHKLPSGFPSRRVWLHLQVKDNANQIVFESGKPDGEGRLPKDSGHVQSDCMAVIKPAGFDNQVCYEPHRDVISDPDQVAVYEAVMGDTNNNITYVLLLANRYLKDNRLLPQGFTEAAAVDIQTLPAGVVGDGDFNIENNQQGSGSDTVHYRLMTTGHNGPYRVEAQLLYQAIRPEFVGSMHSDGGRVDRFRIMYDELAPLVEVLATVTDQY